MASKQRTLNTMLDAVSKLSKREKEQSLYYFFQKKKVKCIISREGYLSLGIILGGGQSLAPYPERLSAVSISDANVSFLMWTLCFP